MGDSRLSATEGKTEYASRLIAKAAADTDFEVYKAEKALEGYTVIKGEIVPKNAATGEDDLTAQRTVRWSEVIEDNGKFFVNDRIAKVDVIKDKS